MEMTAWKDVAAEAITLAVVQGLMTASTADSIVAEGAIILVTVTLPLPDGRELKVVVGV